MQHLNGLSRREFVSYGTIVIGMLALPARGSAQQALNDPAPDGGQKIREFLVPWLTQTVGFQGLATYDSFGPVIYYDATWLDGLGPKRAASLRFFRAHEYAHHRRRHIPQVIIAQGNGDPWVSFAAELDADCWAVHLLRQRKDIPAMRAGGWIYAHLPAATFGGRPGSHDRLKNMKMCGAQL